MTVKEIKAMLANMNDNDEVKFITSFQDRDGYWNETETNVIKIVNGNVKPTRNEYGAYVYEG